MKQKPENTEKQQKRPPFGRPAGSPVMGLLQEAPMSEEINLVRPDFEALRKTFLRLDTYCVLLGAVLELIIFYLTYRNHGQVMEGAVGRYFFLHLVLPFCLNIFFVGMAASAKKRFPEGDMRANVFPIFSMMLISLVINLCHCVTPVLLAFFSIPVFMTSVFCNKKLCKVVTLISVVELMIVTIARCLVADEIAGLDRTAFQSLVALFFLSLAGFVTRTLLNMTERQKEKLFDFARTSREAQARMEDANRAKSDFLANMSHEIRTPINAILGMNEMILRENENEKIAEYADNIEAASTSLLYLINDILDFTKIESGKFEIVEMTYDTSSLIYDCCNMIAGRIQQKGLEMKIDCDPKLPSRLKGDEVRIRQVITNLLSNAAKYTERGKVFFCVKSVMDKEKFSLVVTVKDTGIGIKEKNLKNLFTQFTRFDLKRNRNIEGSGLGLAITKQLVDLMGGKIEVQSVYGEGSEFCVTIPQKVVDDTPLGNFHEHYQDVLNRRNVRYLQSFEAPDARILVVDDVEVNLKVIVNLLKKTRLRVDTAGSGAKALEMVVETPYDIIFLDHMMPEMSGIETYGRIKEMETKNKNTPVIMLTANAISGVREQYLSLGFVDYLSKPVQSGRLEQMIMKYLPKDKFYMVTREEQEGEQAGQESEETALAKRLMPDLDAGTAMKTLGGAESYCNILQIYYNEGSKKTDTLKEALAAGNLERYVIEVHGLKSSSANIGANALSGLAKQHEEAGKAANMEFIEGQKTALFESYQKVLSQIHAYLQEKGVGEPEVKTETERLPIEEDALRTQIQTALSQLQDFKSKEAAKTVEELLQYSLPEKTREMLEHVKKLLAVYEDDAAEEALEAFLDG